MRAQALKINYCGNAAGRRARMTGDMGVIRVGRSEGRPMEKGGAGPPSPRQNEIRRGQAGLRRRPTAPRPAKATRAIRPAAGSGTGETPTTFWLLSLEYWVSV